jgi:hypothetical protein
LIVVGAAENKPSGKKRHKATRLEKLYRLRELQTLCINGYSSLDLHLHCMEKWGLSLASARLYTKEVYATMHASFSEIDHQQQAMIIFYRYENSYKLARAMKNPLAMIKACSEQANMFVKKAPDADIAANQVAREAAQHDPREDFE